MNVDVMHCSGVFKNKIYNRIMTKQFLTNILPLHVGATPFQDTTLPVSMQSRLSKDPSDNAYPSSHEKKARDGYSP